MNPHMMKSRERKSFVEELSRKKAEVTTNAVLTITRCQRLSGGGFVSLIKAPVTRQEPDKEFGIGRVRATVRRFLTWRLGCSSHTCRSQSPAWSISLKRAGPRRKRLTFSRCSRLHDILQPPSGMIPRVIAAEIVLTRLLDGVCKEYHLGNPQSELWASVDARHRYPVDIFLPLFKNSPFHQGKFSLPRIARAGRKESFIRPRSIRRRFTFLFCIHTYSPSLSFSLFSFLNVFFPPFGNAWSRSLQLLQLKRSSSTASRDRSILMSLSSRNSNFWNLRETNACAYCRQGLRESSRKTEESIVLRYNSTAPNCIRNEINSWLLASFESLTSLLSRFRFTMYSVSICNL